MASKHPFKVIRGGDKELRKDKTRQFLLCQDFLEDALAEEGCPRLKFRPSDTSRFYKCHCLRVLQDTEDKSMKHCRSAVAKFMVLYNRMSPKERDKQFIDRVLQCYDEEDFKRKREDNKPRFHIPFEPSSLSDDDRQSFPATAKICKGALSTLLGFKINKWTSIMKEAKLVIKRRKNALRQRNYWKKLTKEQKRAISRRKYNARFEKRCIRV